jgi:hypothetical protein
MNETPCPCGKPASTQFQHLGPLCAECFTDVIHRRCRKAAKDAGWLQKGAQVHVFENNTLQGKALSVIFKQVFKGLPLEHAPAEAAVLVIGKTADDEAEDFLNQLFAGTLEQKPAVLNLFVNVTTAEIERYCELNAIVGEKPAKTELRTRLEALDQRYPGSMFALQKSQESFRK